MTNGSPSEALPQRLGLITMAVLLIALSIGPETALWRDATFDHTMTPPARAAQAVFALISSGSALVLLVCSLYDRWSPRISMAAFGIFTLIVVFNTASIFLSVRPYGSDNAAQPPFAAELFLLGHNPYTALTTPDALKRYGMSEELVTFLRDGTPWFGFVYPAGSFLALAPFIAVGMEDVRPVYAVCLLAMMVTLYGIADARYKVPVLAALLLHYAFATGHLAGGLPEPLWGLAVFAGWFFRNQTIAASGLLGIAMTIKQQGAFFLPFYLVLVYRTNGLRRALHGFLAASGVFLVFNLPFIVDAPGPWARQVVGLALAPLPALGVGPATTLAALWPDFPGAVLSAAALLLMGAALLWCLVTPKLPEAAAWVLPLMPLWFSNRSLSSYFYLVPLFALATLLSRNAGQKDRESVDSPQGP